MKLHISLRSSKKAAEVHQERLKVHQSLTDQQRKRLEVYRGLNPEQRGRLIELLAARNNPEPKKSLTQTEVIKQSRVLQSSQASNQR